MWCNRIKCMLELHGTFADLNFSRFLHHDLKSHARVSEWVHCKVNSEESKLNSVLNGPNIQKRNTTKVYLIVAQYNFWENTGVSSHQSVNDLHTFLTNKFIKNSYIKVWEHIFSIKQFVFPSFGLSFSIGFKRH